MGFFDELTDARWLLPDVSPDAPSWIGPPHNLVAATRELHQELWIGDVLALWLTGADVYPTGLRLFLHARWRKPGYVVPPLVPGNRGRDGLCLAVELDGARRALATPRDLAPPTAPLNEVSLVATTCTGTRFGATTELWVWPLPSRELRFVVEWRAQRIPEVSAKLDAAPFVAGLADVTELWPGAGLPRPTRLAAGGSREPAPTGEGVEPGAASTDDKRLAQPVR
jgi:hypothetical protein